MKARLNSHKDTKRLAILDAATELLALKPTATMQEIADAAHIGIATLHRYFDSRDTMMLELAFRAIHLVEEALEGLEVDEVEVEKSLTAILEALIPLGNKMYFLWTDASLYGHPEVTAAETKIQAPILGAIIAWQSKGKLRSDMNSEWVINVIYSLLFTTWQSVHAGNMAKNDAAQILVKTLLYGFATHK
ncbi:TetR/AcrR family transcriptional regulator [Cohnella abietis]|uniref:TetR family transcriptional regulator n=1 Tax=Cohnella abietis TaxID=2507935 RepID=A0A3T1D7W3_9BACL|nr:TetR/AcrR family transcriptional regulator [Cohnella abietis]BBI34177.1 TetR family transcriptional regulator [Cohnella abietis]